MAHLQNWFGRLYCDHPPLVRKSR